MSMTTDELEIRSAIADWARAVRAKDIEGATRHYASDVVAFDLMPPLQLHGIDAYRRRWLDWFASLDGPIDFEMGACR